LKHRGDNPWTPSTITCSAKGKSSPARSTGIFLRSPKSPQNRPFWAIFENFFQNVAKNIPFPPGREKLTPRDPLRGVSKLGPQGGYPPLEGSPETWGVGVGGTSPPSHVRTASQKSLGLTDPSIPAPPLFGWVGNSVECMTESRDPGIFFYKLPYDPLFSKSPEFPPNSMPGRVYKPQKNPGTNFPQSFVLQKRGFSPIFCARLQNLYRCRWGADPAFLMHSFLNMVERKPWEKHWRVTLGNCFIERAGNRADE
jgi:hypothetical protein